ncbi:hypothetical protein [Mycobacteroides abscessus]|uniref:hypothetical protein n=1 Tax=Mycobacteroides abscessus TaxID=36809 RepID=UPI00092C212D|nr:hypothetical protein [Mycobacteroides abscessus]MBN7436660.1 hypothetical protein [Mycobacteroides abscessus subsp. abscessus]SHT55517.1 Uncharacterised protein [Mycobacteroides abscessus subsp. abscessus]SHY56871.1 Uncharacterised protein [Mycobacteroides abscessus subsp. abscessus]SID53487.1 Uncharacterised protein [Mycobacteroides abscessus subsp. abscessus]SIK07427.1 Uncharacterised protein [Mycobacteroides abscessus subsp. abscessus]
MARFSGTAREPGFWLALGLPWPDDAQDGIAECVRMIPPIVVNMSSISRAAQEVFDLAQYFATSSGHRVVMLAELTRWLGHHGKSWGSRGIDFDAVYQELITLPLPSLYFALDKISYIVLCDATKTGVRIYFPDEVQHKTSEDREELRGKLTAVITQEWPPYLDRITEQRG